MDLGRLNSYIENHCWQYDIRIKNLDKDLIDAGLTQECIKGLRVRDFYFECVTDDDDKKTLKLFIERHEWLGTLSQYTTHWFGCYLKRAGEPKKLAGVLLFNMPNAFSKLLGDDTPQLERLISRGACISWSPKNLASAFLMHSIKWLVKNTQWRLFTAYSDPTAKELGTIYQACNFYYLGQVAGAKNRYINPYTGNLVSDRYFRQKTAYKKYAKELGIVWGKDWNHASGMSWDNIPDDIEAKLRKASKEKQQSSECITLPLKHKYAYVLGSSKAETRGLRMLFESRNKTHVYPQNRG